MKNFLGAIIITPEPLSHEFVTGAWNYAIRKTAPGFDTVNYNAALQWLRENHTDWFVSEQETIIGVVFARGHNKMEHYAPPNE